MSSPSPSGALVAVLPCNDLNKSEHFYARLGFVRVGSQHWRPPPGEPDDYRILSNGKGGHIHLAKAADGWLVPGKNPFGLYLYFQDVDVLAAEFHDELRGKRGPEDKPWGTYEFALCDPDQTLVRVGWPTRMRKSREHT